MSEVAASTQTVDRPYGLDYTPDSVKPYNAATDIPANALDAKDFPTIDAWLDACIAQNKPGKIGSGEYVVDGEPRYAPMGIYGYGETPPKFVAENVNTWLYLSDEKVTIKGVAFEGFGTVLGGAVPLQEGTPYHSDNSADFRHYTGGVPMLDVPASSSVVGPAIDISDCLFIDCRNAFTFVSDTTQMGRIDFNGNTLTGTWGILDVNSVFWTEVYAANNEWSDAVQPDIKQNGYQTGFKIGTDHYVDLPGHYTKLEIVNNYAHDITSVGTYQDTNAAVFIDVRSAESKNHGDNIISYNEIVRVKGVLGQEDSNAIYAKAWGLIIEGNYIEDTGADYVDAKRNGSETAGILVKPMTDAVAKDIEIIGNTLVDMPIPQGSKIDLSAIKLSEAVGDSSVSFNTFIGGGNHSSAAGAGILRIYSTIEHIEVIGNTFIDADIAPGASAITFHSTVRFGDAVAEVSNNTAIKTDGDYSADTKLINFTGSPKWLIAGNNTLDGGFDMLMSRKANEAATVKTYTPEQVVLASDDYVIGVQDLTAVAENTPTETFIAKLSTLHMTSATAKAAAASASVSATYAVDDDRFYVKNGSIYLKPGQTLDYEAEPSVTLTVAAKANGETILTTIDVDVKNVNEALKALTATTPKTLAENTAVATKIAQLSVADPDAAGAFAPYSYTVSDNRFMVQDGALYLKAGQSVDYEKEKSIAVKVTANDGAGSASTTVNIAIGDVAEATAPTPPTTPTTPTTPPTGGTGSTAPKWAESAKWTNTINGTTGEDTIVGTAKNDYIDGKDRLDTMAGGKGDDTYVISGYKDVIIEKAGEGVDTVIVNDNRYFLTDNLENATAGAKTNGVTLVGNASSNILKGSAGADIISGRSGDDYLIGNGGADVFVITDGVDDIIGDFSSDDKILLDGSDYSSFSDLKAAFKQVGADAVLALGDGSLVLKNVQVSSLTASMFDYDNLSKVATASGAYTKTFGGTGNGELFGGSANNDLLDGKGGGDVMMGGAGDDTYMIKSSTDRVIEHAKQGVDQVFVYTSEYRLDANVENIVIKGKAATVEGNAGANIIIGGEGSDTIIGGGGADRLTGGAGRDIFVFDSLGDKGDTITDFKVGTDKLDVSELMAGHSDYKLSFTQLSTGLAVYVDHDGVHDLLATLTGVNQPITADLIT